MEVKDDTTINGVKYMKYYVAESNKSGPNYPTTNLKSINKLIGGIRNDVANKKVYLYLLNTQKEELLYDFDLHLGDTLFKDDKYRFYRSLLSDDPTPEFDTVWVSHIDSVLMPQDGLYHKRFNFKTKFWYSSGQAPLLINSDSVFRNQYFKIKINPLVEGIGADFNPVTIYNQFEFSFDYHLYCRTIDGKTAYSDTLAFIPFMAKTNCNSIITAIDEEEENTNITIYPNPGTGTFNLLQTEFAMKFFEIYNAQGIKIIEESIQSNDAIVDMTSQPKGIYLIRMLDNNQNCLVRKIILE
jgi:hypothetical protein